MPVKMGNTLKKKDLELVRRKMIHKSIQWV